MALAIIACLVAILMPEAAGGQTVCYDDTSGYTNANFEINSGFAFGEAGNEIILAGGPSGGTTVWSNYITQFAVQFALTGSTASPAGGELVEVNFYMNNGSPVEGAPSPGTLFWSSGFMSLTNLGLTNFTTGLALNVMPNVAAPQDFTWTVAAANIPPAEQFALLMNSQPSVGGNYTNMWVNASTQSDAVWEPVVAGAECPPLQLGCEIWSAPIPAAGVFQRISALTNGAAQLGFTGTLGATYSIEVSTNLVSWAPLAMFTNITGPVEFTDNSASNFPCRYYTLFSGALFPIPPTLGPLTEPAQPPVTDYSYADTIVQNNWHGPPPP